MKRRTRVYYTEKQKTLMWDRWKQGDSMTHIAGLFNRPHTTVQGMFSRAGGIRPPIRKRFHFGCTYRRPPYRSLFL